MEKQRERETERDRETERERVRGKQANNKTDKEMSDSEKCTYLGVLLTSSYSPWGFLPQNPITL